jgi:hypothetical protein
MNHSKNICLVDLDDTLVDLKEPMKQALDSFTGKDIPWNKWEHFDVPSIYGVSNSEFLDACIEHEVLERAEIHAESYKFLNDLKRMDCHVVLITARGWHPRGKEVTEKYISDHELNIDELILVDVDESKAEWAKRFNKIKFTVDDRMKHCREYMKTGVVEKVMLYDAPWNSYMTKLNPFVGGYDYHERIKNLHHIMNHVELDNNEELKNVC